ncbi:MAG: tetratricopeptide repeat protein [Polyangiaceae bacterium]
MTEVARPPSAGLQSPPVDQVTEAALDRLREELDWCENELSRAVLLHEIALLESARGDESSAARDHLEAVNAEPEFSEPLERLIAILRGRGSQKNLEKLLERLVEVADGGEERARALLERARYLHAERDFPGAITALEEATQERPNDSTLWLMLELCAAEAGDEEMRVRALTSRAGACEHPTWQALLRISAARIELALGETERCLDALDAALESKSQATFLVLQTLEDVARELGRDDVLAKALEAQAAVITSARETEDAADKFGVPSYARGDVHAADALYRAAEAHRRRGDVTAATQALDKAQVLAPEEPVLARARIHLAQASGDTETAAKFARTALDRGAKGALAAALWMRVAERAAEAGDVGGALDAVNHALEQDAACIPARVLQLDLCAATDAGSLASALEAAHELLSTDEARARCFLLAADSWARGATDLAGAKAALSQAGMVGASPGTVARVSRYLASVMGEANWYDEATRRLLASGAAESELPGLWFELVRARLARGELDAARQTLSGLMTAPGGARFAHLLGAYVLPLVLPGTGADSLRALGESSDDPEVARAFLLAAALRASDGGDTESAQESLGKLFDEDPSDLTAVAALAGVARRRNDVARAAETLSAASLAVDDEATAAALALESGIYHWQAGARTQAVDAFRRAAHQAPESGRVVHSWALRAADPDSAEARGHALDALEDRDPEVAHLERFALRLGDPTADHGGRLEGPTDDSALGVATTLARALCSGEEADSLDALDALAELGPNANSFARAMEHGARLRAGDRPDPVAAADSAARWSGATAGAAAALEHLAFASALGDTEAEVEARIRLARALPDDARAQLAASAAIVRELGTTERSALLEGTDPTTQLTNLELALPGSDPRRRARVLLEAESCFGDEHSAMMRTLAGYNLLAAGQSDAAATLFRSVVEAYPEEVLGWEGLRAAGEALGDRTLVAEACACLGDAVNEDARGAELWEYAALILIDELGDSTRGEFALTRAVERDVGRFVAFDKLFRIVRAKKDGPRLLELITKRLEVAEDPDEIAKLFWERARVMRAAGDRAGALAALENVTMLEPDHVGALALSGEIYITTGQFAEAANSLARLAKLDEAPAKQRLMSGVAAVDLFENKLGEPRRALEVLRQLHGTGLSTLPVRERLARLAAKLEAWEDATQVLQQLMVERDTSSSRVEAARLAMAIHRDRRHAPAEARAAVEKLLGEVPDDGEALDLVLSGVMPGAVAQTLLARGRDTIVAKLMQDPLDAEAVDRLARIAHRLDQPRIRQAALGALVALGQGTPDIDRELAILDQRVARVPNMAVDEAAIPELCDPHDRGPIPALMRVLATTFASALGPSLDALGVGKKQRVDPRAGLPLRNEIAAWAGALGVGDFEVYVGGNDPDGVYGVANETPAIVVGASVQAPLSAAHRAVVARELFALKRGTTILRHRDPTDVAALIVAACAVAEVPVAAPHYAMLGEFQRVLSKETPRKVRKLLPDLARHIQASSPDKEDWVRAATSSLDRLASVAAGDVSWVLAHNAASRGQLGASMEAKARAARILAFVLSPTYLSIREMLGMGVR